MSKNKNRLRLLVSLQIRTEEISPLKIDHVLHTCSWAYVADAFKRPGDYPMANAEQEKKEELEEEEQRAGRKLDFVVVRYQSAGGKKTIKLKDKDQDKKAAASKDKDKEAEAGQGKEEQPSDDQNKQPNVK